MTKLDLLQDVFAVRPDNDIHEYHEGDTVRKMSLRSAVESYAGWSIYGTMVEAMEHVAAVLSLRYSEANKRLHVVVSMIDDLKHDEAIAEEIEHEA